jgi:hypothetical protein
MISIKAAEKSTKRKKKPLGRKQREKQKSGM